MLEAAYHDSRYAFIPAELKDRQLWPHQSLILTLQECQELLENISFDLCVHLWLLIEFVSTYLTVACDQARPGQYIFWFCPYNGWIILRRTSKFWGKGGRTDGFYSKREIFSKFIFNNL
jgi:hypothetical protein